MVTEVDVLVVGAGPVGGWLAHRLADAGVEVLLIEEHDEIGRPFQCAGLVTPSTMDLVGLHDTILTKVWGARMHAPNGLFFRIGHPSQIREHVVCRKLFDQGIVKMAVDSGSSLWLGARAISGGIDANSIKIDVEMDGVVRQVRCRLLCGADGAHSWVRRRFRFGRSKEMMVGFQVEVIGYPGEDGFLDMYTGSEVAPGLFAWAIPNGETHRIGVWSRPGDLGGRSCEDLYQSLINHDLWRDRFEDVVETARYCGPIPTGFLNRLARERVLLYGDAAAVCKPTTGGGIGPGIDQVEALHGSLMEALAKDDLSERRLTKIAKPLKKMRKEQERARVLRDLFLTESDDQTLDDTFAVFARPEVISMINELGDIERPVPLGIRMLKEVPEFRGMAMHASWALLTG